MQLAFSWCLYARCCAGFRECARVAQVSCGLQHRRLPVRGGGSRTDIPHRPGVSQTPVRQLAEAGMRLQGNSSGLLPFQSPQYNSCRNIILVSTMLMVMPNL